MSDDAKVERRHRLFSLQVHGITPSPDAEAADEGEYYLATGEAKTEDLDDAGRTELEATNRGAQIFANFERDILAEERATQARRRAAETERDIDIDDGC